MKLVCAMLLGFVLDLIFGDPHGLVHPVQIIGWFIDKLKKGMQHLIYGCSYEEVKEKGIERKAGMEKAAGFFLMLCIVAGTYAVIYGILYVAGMIYPMLRFCLETFFIYKKLKERDLLGARKEVSYLVGRDTENLDESEVAKADVETIAENTADGVIAPMLFIALGGAPLGFAYKAVNTLDSMVAYRNEELIHIGFFSAKMDDICNFVPARFAAVMMMLAAFFLRFDFKGAVRIFKRDRFAHLSPNSAQTEAVAAGALQIQLGGTHNYFGKAVVKPTIGDAIRPVEYEDIKRTNQLLYVSAFLSMAVCTLITFLLYVQLFNV